MEIDKIYNMDCLEGMRQIPDGSIDAVICDLPYGTMKGINAPTFVNAKATCEWDECIPTDKLFEAYGRVLRRGGVAILFSMEPYTSHLRQFKGTWMEFRYPMYWKKEKYGNALFAAKAPLSYIEDISVFSKRNSNDAEKLHPLRRYGQQVLDFIGKSCGEIQDDFRNWDIPNPTRVAHFLRPDGLQFKLCTAETYGMLIERYGIDKMDGYREWSDLNEEESFFIAGGQSVFNLPEGKEHLSNVLEFAKDTDGFHPTQKPVALIRRLVLTYTNEGDTVLDNCMGSGTTAIACIKEKRHFIGFELSKEYFDKAQRRIKAEQAQLTLW